MSIASLWKTNLNEEAATAVFTSAGGEMAGTVERVWVATDGLPERETEQIGALAQEHARMVYAIALSMLRNHADAEDAMQECFLRVLRFGWRLRFEEHPRAYIARIAQRCAIDVRRRRRREEPVEEHELPSNTDEHGATELAQELAQLAAAIRSLPEDLRSVMELQQSGELTSEEIGGVLGIPAGTVRTRVLRAKQLLRQKLERRRP